MIYRVRILGAAGRLLCEEYVEAGSAQAAAQVIGWRPSWQRVSVRIKIVASLFNGLVALLERTL